MKKIIIYCPAFSVSGGPELAHQLCHRINSLNLFEAYMCYVGKGKKSIPEPYKKYNLKVIDCPKDVETNMIVVPETMIQILQKFKKAKKTIWWMSVDNFYVSENYKYLKIKKILHLYYDFRKQNDIYHFVQSEYAKQFLLKNNVKEKKIYHVSDYLNNLFIEQASNSKDIKKNNVVLYNPKKGYELTKKIIEFNSDIQFIPLINLTREEMQSLLSKSKVYIDFGNHPGKDRIPREAAISGCCVITGKKGSAKYYDDVSILDKYKFDDDNINMNDLRRVIIEIFDNYDSVKSDFESYRDKIRNEENIFNAEVEYALKDIFGE